MLDPRSPKHRAPTSPSECFPGNACPQSPRPSENCHLAGDQALVRDTETAKIIAELLPPFPECPVRMAGVQQATPGETRTSEKLKSEMDLAS